MFGLRKSQSKRITRLEDAIGVLTKHVTALQDDLADLEDKHVRLRGRVYATGAHKEPEEDKARAPRARMSRDELRKLSGFTPGQPMRHEE